MRARRGLLIVVAVTLLLAACRVDTTVRVDLHRDGSGLVRVRVDFDADAARRVPVSSIRLDDLQAAGWRVSRDSKSVTIEKPFPRPSELGSTVRELTGGTKVLVDASAARDRGFLRTTYKARVDIDLRPLAAGVLNDPELRARLRLVGVDPAAMELELDAPLRRAVRARVVVSLSGGKVRTWNVPINGHVDARATASSLNTERVSWGLAAVVLAGLAAIVLLLGALLPARRRRRRRGRTLGDGPAPGVPAHERAAEEASP